VGYVVSLTKKNIETLAYDVINDICDEFDIELNEYPEVYWIGNHGTSFKKLFLKKNYKEDYSHIKSNNISAYLRIPNIILISSNDYVDLGEECGHYIHFNSSNISYTNKNAQDSFATSVITEMLGYFSSKLFVPERTVGVYAEYPDTYNISIKEKNALKKSINSIYPAFSFYKFCIYQQGYSLGECLYNNYISGIVSQNNIKELFLQPHEEKYSATNTFIRLKETLS